MRVLRGSLRVGARRGCEDGAAVEGEGESGDEWADGAEAEAEGWVAEGGLVGLRLLSCLCVWHFRARVVL